MKVNRPSLSDEDRKAAEQFALKYDPKDYDALFDASVDGYLAGLQAGRAQQKACGKPCTICPDCLALTFKDANLD